MGAHTRPKPPLLVRVLSHQVPLWVYLVACVLTPFVTAALKAVVRG